MPEIHLQIGRPFVSQEPRQKTKHMYKSPKKLDAYLYTDFLTLSYKSRLANNANHGESAIMTASQETSSKL